MLLSWLFLLTSPRPRRWKFSTTPDISHNGSFRSSRTQTDEPCEIPSKVFTKTQPYLRILQVETQNRAEVERVEVFVISPKRPTSPKKALAQTSSEASYGQMERFGALQKLLSLQDSLATLARRRLNRLMLGEKRGGVWWLVRFWVVSCSFLWEIVLLCLDWCLNIFDVYSGSS